MLRVIRRVDVFAVRHELWPLTDDPRVQWVRFVTFAEKLDRENEGTRDHSPPTNSH